jgi:death on curing protein
VAGPAGDRVRRGGQRRRAREGRRTLHSLARNYPLVDGDKRLALAATIAFYGIDGYRLALTNDEAYALVMRVADGSLDDITPIADVVRGGVEPRDPSG